LQYDSGRKSEEGMEARKSEGRVCPGGTGRWGEVHAEDVMVKDEGCKECSRAVVGDWVACIEGEITKRGGGKSWGKGHMGIGRNWVSEGIGSDRCPAMKPSQKTQIDLRYWSVKGKSKHWRNSPCIPGKLLESPGFQSLGGLVSRTPG